MQSFQGVYLGVSLTINGIFIIKNFHHIYLFYKQFLEKGESRNKVFTNFVWIVQLNLPYIISNLNLYLQEKPVNNWYLKNIVVVISWLKLHPFHSLIKIKINAVLINLQVNNQPATNANDIATVLYLHWKFIKCMSGVYRISTDQLFERMFTY